MDYTSLGLNGAPSADPFFEEFAQSYSSRPDNSQFTGLSAYGGALFAQGDFDGKDPSTPLARPNEDFTELSAYGGPGVVYTFTPKRGSVGTFGSTTISIAVHATMGVGRRYSTKTDLVTSFRSFNAQITVAHAQRISGRTTFSITPMAGRLHYQRSGTEHIYVGNNAFTITPFGHITYRKWKVLSGTNSVVITPRATLVYTPSPQRSLHINASTTIRITPSAGLALTHNGVHHGIVGTSSFSISTFGRVFATRETTYATHGHNSFSIRPQGSITRYLAPPVSHHINGQTQFTITPNANLTLLTGFVQQHYVVGVTNIRILPMAKVTVERAPVMKALSPVGQRRLLRVG